MFTPKYRRKAIYGQIRSDIGEILRRLCEHKGVEIIEGHLMPDHVHMLLAIPPKYSVSSVMGYLKGKALEDGDKRLAASYAHLEEAERIGKEMDTYWAEQHWCLYLGGAEVISTFISGRVGGYTGERLFKNWNANQILARIWVTD